MQVAGKTCCHENMDVAFFQSSRISKALIAFLRKSKSVWRHKGNVRPVQAMQTTYDGQILVENISLIFLPPYSRYSLYIELNKAKMLKIKLAIVFPKVVWSIETEGNLFPKKIYFG